MIYYHLERRKRKEKQKMNERLAGVIVGAVFGVVIMLLILKVFLKRKNITGEYDERQTLIIGKGYKYGLFGMCACECILAALSSLEVTLPVVEPAVHFCVIAIGILIFACYAVWNGAYWGILSEAQYKNSVRVIAAIAVLNFISPVIAISKGTFIEDGKLQSPFINLVCGLMLTVILLLTFIRSRIRDDETEE